MDLDLRKLRYFVAVAEHAGFRRAADALHVAQPALTRQIRSLEREFDVQLFTRTAHGSALTPAGIQLLDEAKPLLAAAAAIKGRVSRAGAGPRLTIGFAPGIRIAPVIKAYGRLHPDVAIEFLSTPADDQTRLILEERVDACFLRLPIARDGLTLLPLFEERHVVALPAGHPLTRRHRVTVRDLIGLTLLQDPDGVPELRAISPVPLSRREPSPDTRAIPGVGVEDQLEHVAADRGVVVLPQSIAALYSRPGVVYRAVDGLASSSVVLAWGAAGDTAEVRQLTELAVAMMRPHEVHRAVPGSSSSARNAHARSA